MIHVKPPHLRAVAKELPMEKTYSYTEVENLVRRAILVLAESRILHKNKIKIKCFPDPMERGVRLNIHQEGEEERAILFIARRDYNGN